MSVSAGVKRGELQSFLRGSWWTRYLELELESDHVRAVDTGQTLVFLVVEQIYCRWIDKKKTPWQVDDHQRIPPLLRYIGRLEVSSLQDRMNCFMM